MAEIVNRVKESGLISIDLANYKPTLKIVSIDLSDLLWKGLVLKEKDFREWAKNHDWSNYTDKGVYIHCSTDAIVPTWSYMLITSELKNFTDDFIVGTKKDLKKEMIRKNIHSDDLEKYIDGRVIIKGCADITEPAYAMSELVRFLQPVVKSIMYGEPCSTVLFLRRKKRRVISKNFYSIVSNSNPFSRRILTN